MLESNPVVASYALTANPDLQGQTAIQIFDRVVNALAAQGLLIILDNHSSDAEWCCGNDGNTLWQNAAYPEAAWIRDWQSLAQRYANQPYVIGCDLRNEPRITATWGGAAATDWNAAATRGGNAVLTINPQLLIFVEGVNYATDLSGAANLPVLLNEPNRLVYSAHDYGFDYNALASATDWLNQINPRWGYLVTGPNPQPFWLGEFGTCNTSLTCVTSASNTDNGFWFSILAAYARNQNLNWSYWALNGTQSTGSTRTFGAAETYGILSPTWNGTASPALTLALQQMQTPRVSPRQSPNQGPSPERAAPCPDGPANAGCNCFARR